MKQFRVSRKLALVALLGILMLLITACGGTPTAGPASSGSSSAAQSSSAAPKPLNLKIGQSADYSGLTVTVVSAGKGPKDFSGKPTYKISVTYKNTGTDSAAYNELDWALQDANGARTQNTAILSNSPTTLGSGNLAPGGSTSGVVYYTPGASVAKIVYQPSMFSGEENLATWNAK